jgi:hypothetical protein
MEIGRVSDWSVDSGSHKADRAIENERRKEAKAHGRERHERIESKAPLEWDAGRSAARRFG